MYVIGDVHGCHNTLEKLLDKLPDWHVYGICFVGDLIDRGPKSAHVVRKVRELENEYQNVWCVRGNHEQMMVDEVDNEGPAIRFSGLWTSNGGVETISSYKDLYGQTWKHSLVYDKLWMESLPVYYRTDHQFEGKEIVVSHSHITKAFNKRHDPEIKGYFERSTMWGRNVPKDMLCDDIYNVIGHTIVEEPKVTEDFTNLDTGAFLGSEKWKQYCIDNSLCGKLTALKIPEMTLISQETVEE